MVDSLWPFISVKKQTESRAAPWTCEPRLRPGSSKNVGDGQTETIIVLFVELLIFTIYRKAHGHFQEVHKLHIARTSHATTQNILLAAAPGLLQLFLLNLDNAKILHSGRNAQNKLDSKIRAGNIDFCQGSREDITSVYIDICILY